MSDDAVYGSIFGEDEVAELDAEIMRRARESGTRPGRGKVSGSDTESGTESDMEETKSPRLHELSCPELIDRIVAKGEIAPPLSEETRGVILRTFAKFFFPDANPTEVPSLPACWDAMDLPSRLNHPYRPVYKNHQLEQYRSRLLAKDAEVRQAVDGYYDELASQYTGKWTGTNPSQEFASKMRYLKTRDGLVRAEEKDWSAWQPICNPHTYAIVMLHQIAEESVWTRNWAKLSERIHHVQWFVDNHKHLSRPLLSYYAKRVTGAESPALSIPFRDNTLAAVCPSKTHEKVLFATYILVMYETNRMLERLAVERKRLKEEGGQASLKVSRPSVLTRTRSLTGATRRPKPRRMGSSEMDV